MMIIGLLYACLVMTVVRAQVGKQCSSDIDCGDEACCQIPNEYMVVSRRAASPGTCQPYIEEDAPCDIFGKINGFCSCYPGYSCMAVEIPIGDASVDNVQKRMLIAPKPGYTYNIKCVRDITE